MSALEIAVLGAWAVLLVAGWGGLFASRGDIKTGGVVVEVRRMYPYYRGLGATRQRAFLAALDWTWLRRGK